MYEVDIDDYKRDAAINLSQAWKLAKDNIQHAQEQQKKQYDRKARAADLNIGDQVMVYMPAEVQGKNWKLARPFHGPYHVVSKTLSNVEVRIVDDPTANSIFVSLDRVRLCYPEQGNETWTGTKRKKKKRTVKKQVVSSTDLEETTSHIRTGPVTRSMIRSQ